MGSQLRILSLAATGRKAIVLQTVGWIIWFTGQALGQVAIVLAPATVVASVTFSGSLLCNALLAPLILSEHLTRTHWLGIFLLSTGGTSVTLTASHSDEIQGWAWLSTLIYARQFQLVAVGSALAALAVLARCMCRTRKSRDEARLDMLGFAFLFALTGSSDLLITKFSLRLLVNASKGEGPGDMVVSGFTTLMLCLHICTFFFQVYSTYYRQALQSVPLFLASGALMQVVLCGTFFQEFNISGDRAVIFAAGFFLMLVGMLVTSQAQPAETDEKDTEFLSPIGTPVADLSPVPQSPSKRSPLKGKKLGVLTSHSIKERSLSNHDMLLLVDIQRSSMCFGEKAPVLENRQSLGLPETNSAPELAKYLLEDPPAAMGRPWSLQEPPQDLGLFGNGSSRDGRPRTRQSEPEMGRFRL